MSPAGTHVPRGFRTRQNLHSTLFQTSLEFLPVRDQDVTYDLMCNSFFPLFFKSIDTRLLVNLGPRAGLGD
jgi:hypothetical protein